MNTAGTIFPEMWISGPPTPKGEESLPVNLFQSIRVITAFVHTSSADTLSAMGEEAALKELLKLLDTVFGGSLASNAFVKGCMVDWSQEPYIEGGCAANRPTYWHVFA